jgi:hypothetical protein
MSEQLTIDGENVVCSHQLVIRIHQMEDGSVQWNVMPDAPIYKARKYDVWGLAEIGAPLAALAIRALWKLCYDGMVYNAIEQGIGAQLAVERMSGQQPPELLEAMPMESTSIN